MQLGEIKDETVIAEYVGHLENAIAVAKEMKGDPKNSKYSANIGFVIDKLERIRLDTRQGKIVKHRRDDEVCRRLADRTGKTGPGDLGCGEVFWRQAAQGSYARDGAFALRPS